MTRTSVCAVIVSIACAAIVPGAARAQCPNSGVCLPTGPVFDISKPNFAYSPNLRKFVNSLPGVGAPGCILGNPSAANSCHENDLGEYIPLAQPDTTTYSDSDYYELGLRTYTKQMHSDLPTTALRGYYQKNGVDSSSQYLGPLIIAQRNRPVRLKLTNELPISTAPGSNLPLPVDTTIMGAGMGPLDANGAPCDPTVAMCATYTQNRATIHLHGGFTPWISDGTPHQWITPLGETSPYKKGVAFQNVPDMIAKFAQPPSPGDGIATYYYPNQQSARLMFYHDHAYGITRLNVYAGEAAGYLLTDPAEGTFIANMNASGLLPDLGGVYHYGIPLVIQDRTFVNDAATSAATSANLPQGVTGTSLTTDVDPLWKWGLGGNLWFPHEYMPNENIYDTSGGGGFNPMGRWDYAPWMIPPMPVLNNFLPSPTLIPEAYGDTMIVNGTAFPYVTLSNQATRFRILNACNDRMLNLQLYYAATPAGVLCDGVQNFDAVTGTFAQASCTEVSMVPAAPGTASPPGTVWPSDGRPGGVPDPKTSGPDIIQIGNEAGFLAQPAVWPSQPIDFDYSRRSVTFGGVTSHALLLLPAFRADVVVDLKTVPPGAVLMLYNDAPAPMPLFDPRNDLFTNDPDQRSQGGAPPTPAGFGPNTRTVMQIRIDPAGSPAPGYSTAALVGLIGTEVPAAYGASQDAPLVPNSAYDAAFGTLTQNNVYANAVDDSLNPTGQVSTVLQAVVTAPGVNYKTAPTVTFSGGGPNVTLPATATACLNGVTGITLVTAGSGYTSPPSVTISQGGGKGATAVATISGGVVTAVTVMNPGCGYTKAPNVTLSGGGAGAVQATATATVTLGSVGTITLGAPNFGGKGYTSAPLISLTGGGGTGATAVAMLAGSVVLDGKNLVEGFDMEFGRMNAVLGSTPNPLTPNVGAGPVIGAAFYVDPPTEIMKGGCAPGPCTPPPTLWRLSHVGVDSHAIHFHLFNVQVVNRVDWTNTIKPPYPDEIGWKETIRTNPFEDVIIAVRPAAMSLPFALPNSNRYLDPTMPAGSTANFSPAAPPPGLPAVAGTTNVVTNYGWEYVWHCHLLGHEENDMMRPIVFQPHPPVLATDQSALVFNMIQGGAAPPPQTLNLWNNTGFGSQSLVVSNVAITGTGAASFGLKNNCGAQLDPFTAIPLTCGMNVTFTPPATTGTTTAALTMATNDPTKPTVSIPLTGNVSLVGAPATPVITNTTAAVLNKTKDSATVNWTESTTPVPPASFTLQAATNSLFTTGLVSATATATARTAMIGGLTPKTLYYVRIQAVSAAGVRSGWAMTTITTP